MSANCCWAVSPTYFNTASISKVLQDINQLYNLNLDYNFAYNNITNYYLDNDILHQICKLGRYFNLGNNYIIPSNGKNGINAHNDYIKLKQGVAFTEEQWSDFKYNQEDLFLQAKNTAPKRVDPLLVDLDGDGIKTIHIDYNIFNMSFSFSF